MAGHLTAQERDRLRSAFGGFARGFNRKEIADQLERDPSIIRPELERNRSGGEYLPCQAEQKAVEGRRDLSRVRKMDRPEINAFVRRGRSSQWSPGQIAGRLRRGHADEPQQCVSASTI